MDTSRSNVDSIVTRLQALKQRPEAKALANDIDQIVNEVRNLAGAGQQQGGQQQGGKGRNE